MNEDQPYIPPTIRDSLSEALSSLKQTKSTEQVHNSIASMRYKLGEIPSSYTELETPQIPKKLEAPPQKNVLRQKKRAIQQHQKSYRTFGKQSNMALRREQRSAAQNETRFQHSFNRFPKELSEKQEDITREGKRITDEFHNTKNTIEQMKKRWGRD